MYLRFGMAKFDFLVLHSHKPLKLLSIL